MLQEHWQITATAKEKEDKSDTTELKEARCFKEEKTVLKQPWEMGREYISY
jgi:hypothetical protein